MQDLNDLFYFAKVVEAEAAQEVIDRSRSGPQGLIRLSAPPALVCFELGPMLGRYMAANPLVTVELDSTSRRVDVIGEGIDVAFRVRFPPMEDSDLTLRILGDSAQQIVASPDLINQWPAMVAADAIHAGTFVDLLPNWRPVAGSVQAIFPSRRGLLPSVRSLIDFLVTEYAACDHTQAIRIHTNENK